MAKINVVIVVAWYAPYRVPLFREIANHGDIDLTVIFCSAVESGRAWVVPSDLPFKAIFLKSRELIRYTYRDMFGDRNTIRYPFGLFRTLRMINPDVVVAYEFRIECILAALYSLLHGCAYITWSDTTEMQGVRLGLLRRMIRKVLLSRSKALIGSSSDTIDYFHTLFGYPLGRSSLSILSAHVGEFAKSSRMTNPVTRNTDRIVRFLCVGQLIPRKGVDLLITAFSALKHKYPNTRLTLIGDGPQRQSLEHLSRELGCDGKVMFKGNIPYDELPREMVLHDVFVFPTRLDVFGLVVAEAIACGLPVICSFRAGAARDLVSDNGIIVDPMNVRELSAAMETLASDANLRLQMKNANHSVLQKNNLMTAVHGFVAALHIAVTGPT